MELKLRRKFLGPKYTIGDLTINGTFFANTLEDKNRDVNKNGKFDNGEQKVYAETCIPYGKYDIKITYAPKFKRELPWLQDVPHFTGILMHRGVTEKNSAGCILVGKNDLVGRLSNSAEYEKKLVELMKEAIAKGEPVTIEIV